MLCSLVAVLSACASAPAKQDADSYFADATRCNALAQRKQQVRVPVGTTQTVGGTQLGATSQTIVEVPLPADSAAFSACMVSAGHPPPRVDPEPYVKVARACLDETRSAAARDAAYRACIERRGIAVEVLPDEGKK
jgi:hypothetical protein